MGRELDRRDHSVSRYTQVREAELRAVESEVSDELPGDHRVSISSFDPVTGNPGRVTSSAGPGGAGNYVQRALDHVRGINRVLGLSASQSAEFVADPEPQKTSSGAVAVHLQQQYKGIPVFQADEMVRFAPDGTLLETAGTAVTITEEYDATPELSVADAVMAAARHVATPGPDELTGTDQFGEPLHPPGVDLSGFEPAVITMFSDRPDRPAVCEAGPFGDQLTASLMWFPIGDGLTLVWEVLLTMPEYQGQYRVFVDASSGEILYCRQLVSTVAGRASVYRVDGRNTRQTTSFPRPLQDYGLPIPGDLPDGFPDDWLDDERTLGNSANAHLNATGPVLRGQLDNGQVVFEPGDPEGDDQKVLNIFYFNCYMHDYFYLLGFREADGNFQNRNFGRGGLLGDRVDARAHSGAVFGTANMLTLQDGRSPVMNMGLVTSTGRHTAFDSSVVFHEFMHGVTNRLVGGPMNTRALEAPQSGGMGEGWSDYIACSINDTVVVGDWVVDRPGGIRGFPYDNNFPDHFGDIGTGRYSGVHNVGEIWCAALLEMNRQIGVQLGVQLVVDALKLTPANPSFLDARDAIIAALDSRLDAGLLSASEHMTALNGVWITFARYGMGPNARSNGANLSGIVADFDLPAEPTGSSIVVEATPNLSIPDNQFAGVTTALTVAQTGRIREIAVSVDVQHTYIGDLVVTLKSPGGTTVFLHNRSGASADDLVATYISDTNQGLAQLAGEQSQGQWALTVADRAGLDVGTLRRWSVALELEASSQTVRGEVSPGMQIPDNDPGGVSSAISIIQAGIAQGVKVAVDITHTYIGDLRVELLSPAGEQAVLHSRSGGSSDNLIETYDSLTEPALATLVDQPVEGNWVLRVTDLAGLDVGKLNHWSLELTL